MPNQVQACVTLFPKEACNTNVSLCGVTCQYLAAVGHTCLLRNINLEKVELLDLLFSNSKMMECRMF